MSMNLFSENLIKLNLASNTKDEVFREMADLLWDEKRISVKDAFIADVYAREAELSTELENEIAMPHAKSSAVVKPSVVIFSRAF